MKVRIDEPSPFCVTCPRCGAEFSQPRPRIGTEKDAKGNPHVVCIYQCKCGQRFSMLKRDALLNGRACALAVSAYGGAVRKKERQRKNEEKREPKN